MVIYSPVFLLHVSFLPSIQQGCKSLFCNYLSKFASCLIYYQNNNHGDFIANVYIHSLLLILNTSFNAPFSPSFFVLSFFPLYFLLFLSNLVVPRSNYLCLVAVPPATSWHQDANGPKKGLKPCMLR